MATFFTSYAFVDIPMARSLEERLVKKKHRTRLPVGMAVAGNWRAKTTKALAVSDALVAVLTESALRSKYVVGEIGAGRVLESTKGMLVLPVLVGEMGIPDFISDIFCFRCRGANDQDWETLTEELHKAIIDNVRLGPRIFISHRHKDEPIAAALTGLLEQAFYIESTDIRCTSVQPYMLTPGERTSEQLRSDIAGAELVIGILSPDTSESNYVLCELGASWARDIPTFPLLARGATYSDIPSPLNERHSVSMEGEEDCLQLTDYIATKTSLRRREGNSGLVAKQAKTLADAARIRPMPLSSASKA